MNEVYLIEQSEELLDAVLELQCCIILGELDHILEHCWGLPDDVAYHPLLLERLHHLHYTPLSEHLEIGVYLECLGGFGVDVG